MRSLPLLDELEAALTSGSIPRRIDILARVTDLFVNNAESYSEEQIGVFDDVMARLVNAIETKARAKLAQRLAPIANAPSNVIHMLAFDDDIDVAGSVLTLSDRLDERDLLISAGTKSQKHLLAISQRQTLSEAVTNVLVERGDCDVIYSVVKNTGARFSDAGFRMLVDRSAVDDALATRVGMRADIPRAHFLVLLEKASATVRARLSAENPQAKTAIEGVVAEVVSGMREESRHASPDFAAAQESVERQNRIRRIGEADVYEYARDRKFEETAIALSIMCDTPIDVVERALARSRRRDHPHPRQGRRTVAVDHQGDPAVAGRRPRHVGQGPRSGADELQQAADRHRAARAEFLPRPRQEADAAPRRCRRRRQLKSATH